MIQMDYLGVSLYDDFKLPHDWKEQVHVFFEKMTTHNIYYPEFNLKNILVLDEKLNFIDFGLAFHSTKIEDKAVDLHLLQQALEAKHFTIWQECWKIILNNYKAEKGKEILERIKIIESRGRYKDKY